MILMRYVTMVLLGSAHVMAGPRRPGTEQGVLQRGPGGGVRLLRGTWRDAGVQDMGKTIRKPWENHRKTRENGIFHGIYSWIVLSWQLTQFTCFTGGPHPVVRSWTLGSPMKHICFTPIPLVLWPFFMGTLSVLVHLYIVYIYIVLYYYIYMLSMRVAACTCTSMDQSAKSSILKRHRNANV